VEGNFIDHQTPGFVVYEKLRGAWLLRKAFWKDADSQDAGHPAVCCIGACRYPSDHVIQVRSVGKGNDKNSRNMAVSFLPGLAKEDCSTSSILSKTILTISLVFFAPMSDRYP
jgi:hypothetical protein